MLLPSVYVRPARGITPDFSLSSDQSSLSVKESYTMYINNVPESKYYGANANLLLTSLNGFSGTISLTYSAASSFFFQAEDGIRDRNVTGVQTCALPI